MILSAYTVESNPRGFGPCFWPCTTRKGAFDLAKKLSLTLDKAKYPNAFWIRSGKTLGAFLDGKPYSVFGKGSK